MTDPEMTRYFMTIPEAVSLVLQAGAMADKRKVFELDMGQPVKIIELARQMIRLAGHRPDEDIKIEIVGTRPGERLHEYLHDDAEIVEPTWHPSIRSLTPKIPADPTRLSYFLDVWRRCCADAQEQVVVGLLDQMLTECGIECHLDADIATRAYPARRHRRAVTNVAPVPTHPARIDLTAGGVNAASRSRVARRPGRVRARPAVRPSGPPAARTCDAPARAVVQARHAHQRSARRRARSPHRRTPRRRARRRAQLVHVGPHARRAGAHRRSARPGRAPELHVLRVRARGRCGTAARRVSSSACRTRSRSMPTTPRSTSRGRERNHGDARVRRTLRRAGARRARPGARHPGHVRRRARARLVHRRRPDRLLRHRRGVQPHADEAARRRRRRPGRDERLRVSPRRCASVATTATPATTTRASPVSTRACRSSTPRWRSSRSPDSTKRSNGAATSPACTAATSTTFPASRSRRSARARRARSRTSRSASTPTSSACRATVLRSRCSPKASTPASTSTRRCTASAPTATSRPRDLPVTDAVASSVLSLPVYPDLLDEQVERVCDLIHSAHDHAVELDAYVSTMAEVDAADLRARLKLFEQLQLAERERVEHRGQRQPVEHLRVLHERRAGRRS